jgi:Na+/H+-dicarboxylate symporter
MSSKMPFILGIIIIFIIFFGQHIPLGLAEILFGLSLTLKSLIIFLLPLVIFGLLFKSTIILAKDASRVICFIILGVIASNFISTTLSQFVGKWIYTFDMSLIAPRETGSLEGWYVIHFPNLIPNQYALIAGVLGAIVLTPLAPKAMYKFGIFLENLVHKLLKLVTFVIPFFITGFVIKLKFDGSINQIISDYTSIFIVIALAQIIYITFLYWLLSNFSFKATLKGMRNMMPAAISGFSTMSSAASMPLSIIGSEKNTADKDLAHTVVPVTASIHLIGDCIAIPCFAFAVLKNYGHLEPTLFTYLIFTFYFVMAKFSVAAVPGGGIIVMLPILEHHLGFSGEMLSLITALYILFDPVITSANVMGNGVFVKFMDRIRGYIKRPTMDTSITKSVS